MEIPKPPSIPTVPVPPQPSVQNTVPPPNSTKTWIIIAGVVLAMILVAGAVWYVIDRVFFFSPAQDQGSGENKNGASSGDISTNPEQKKYVNLKYDYEFSYPTEVNLSSISDLGNEVEASSNSGVVIAKSPLAQLMKITTVDKGGKTLDQYIQLIAGDNPQNKRENVTISGRPAVKVTNPAKAGSMWYYLEVDNNFFYIASNNQGESIRQTLKWNSIAVDTSNWSVYKNTALNFEMKYPQGYQVVESDGSGTYGKLKRVAVSRNNSDVIFTLTATSSIYIDGQATVYDRYGNVPLDMSMSDRALIDKLNEEYGLGLGINRIFDHQRATIGGKSTFRTMFIAHNNKYTITDDVFLPYNKNGFTNIMIMGPVLVEKSEDYYRQFWNEDWYKKDYKNDLTVPPLKKEISDANYNTNVAENYKLYKSMLDTLKFNF